MGVNIVVAAFSFSGLSHFVEYSGHLSFKMGHTRVRTSSVAACVSVLSRHCFVRPCVLPRALTTCPSQPATPSGALHVVVEGTGFILCGGTQRNTNDVPDVSAPGMP